MLDFTLMSLQKLSALSLGRITTRPPEESELLRLELVAKIMVRIPTYDVSAENTSLSQFKVNSLFSTSAYTYCPVLLTVLEKTVHL